MAGHDGLPRGLAALLVDGHCHPTDALQGDASGAAAEALAARLHATGIGTICAMSTRVDDLGLVCRLVASQAQAQAQAPRPGGGGAGNVVPAFGIHPWYAHHVSLLQAAPAALDKEAHYRALFPSPVRVGCVVHEDCGACRSSNSAPERDELDMMLPYLPDPVPLDQVLATLRTALAANPSALVGEVGLDRAFRLPLPEPVRRELARLGNTTLKGKLSSLATPLAHQRAVLDAQLALASEARRSVSLHAVRATGEVTALLRQLGGSRPNIVLHSCTLTPNALVEAQQRKLVPGGTDFGCGGQIYVSFSAGINLQSTPGKRDGVRAVHKLKDQLRVAAPDRLLTETDHVDPEQLRPALIQLVCVLEEVELERSHSNAEDRTSRGSGAARSTRPRTLDEVFYMQALPAYSRGSYVPPPTAPPPSPADDRRVRILHALRYNWMRFCRPRPVRWDEDGSDGEE